MANSWSKQPVWQGTGSNYLNSVNDATIGGQITTVPNGYASEGNQTLPGDHTVYDEAAANAAGNPALPQLHGGYFQYVQLDPAMAGIGAISEVVTIGGSGGTGYAAATTTVSFAAAPAGGATATGFAVVSSTGVIQAIFVTSQGSGYLTAPAVTITSTGGGSGATGTATIQAASALIPGQALYWKNSGFSGANVYVVTNIQSPNSNNLAGVLLNPSWTPGNYSWIQCYGRVNVLVDATSATVITPGISLYLSASGTTSNGSFTAVAGTAGAFSAISEGWVIASPVAGSTVLADIQKVSLRF